MPSSNRGRSTRAWRRLQAAQRARRLPCFHCGQPIDYDLTWPHPQSFSADHLKPVATHPELAEDPGNLVSSHLLCNQVKGADAHFSPVLGALSERF
jgi:hypothetical protein